MVPLVNDASTIIPPLASMHLADASTPRLQRNRAVRPALLRPGAGMALGVLAVALTAAATGIPQPGDKVFQSEFDTPAERAAWSGAEPAAWATNGYQGSASLRVTATTDRRGVDPMLRTPLDLTRYRGCQLLFECLARAGDVSKPPAPYLGAKFMLHYRSKSEGDFWDNENNVYGTFDWRPLRFTAHIAADATDGELDLGLQESSGTVWFDHVQVTVLKGPPAQRPPAVGRLAPFKGHNLPRLRGVMSPNSFREDDLRTLGGEWNANLIRWQLTRNWGRPGTDRDLDEYDRWLDGRLKELDKALESCRRYGIGVVVDMHSPPGGRYANNELAIFHEKLYQDHFIALWETIARRYQGHPAIWGYDLINEPAQGLPPPPGVADYLEAQARAARAIRAIDPQVPVFIEAARGDSPAGFHDLEPLTVSNVIYEVHLYEPHAFTHQGVEGPWTPIAYPGRIGNGLWNKDRLCQVLEPVREFQRAYNVHIYVGEFSAIRWAPGAAAYLRDCIELFEAYDWDWSYHAYREWDGWSVEHGPDPGVHQPAREPTDRQRLLLEWFGRNIHPGR